MAKVLIDNATISSVQRALGKAQLKEPALLDIEHVCLARFCEAVLLNDSIVVPDNYKSELTARRKALITGDAFSFQQLAEGEDDAIREVSSSLAPAWKEAFRAGSDRSLFSEYFSQANAYSNFIWEHSSSEFFLVFRAHGIEKDNPLIEAVLASTADETLGKELEIIGTDGKPVTWGKLSGHVQRMLSVMGWLGHQYVWHQVFSAQHDCLYMPHPLRDFFAYDFLNRIKAGSKSKATFAYAFGDGLEKFQGKFRDSLIALGVDQPSACVSLPGFLPLVVQESANPDDFMNVLHQMRTEAGVVELRQMLDAIQNGIADGNYKPLAQLKRDMETIGRNILIERGLEDRIIRLTPPTTLFGVKMDGDDSSIKLRIPSILYKQFFVGRTYRAFVKRAMEELAVPAKYGAIKTKLNSWAWIKEDKFPKFYLKKDKLPSLFHKPFSTSVLK